MEQQLYNEALAVIDAALKAGGIQVMQAAANLLNYVNKQKEEEVEDGDQ